MIRISRTSRTGPTNSDRPDRPGDSDVPKTGDPTQNGLAGGLVPALSGRDGSAGTSWACETKRSTGESICSDPSVSGAPRLNGKAGAAGPRFFKVRCPHRRGKEAADEAICTSESRPQSRPAVRQLDGTPVSGASGGVSGLRRTSAAKSAAGQPGAERLQNISRAGPPGGRGTGEGGGKRIHPRRTAFFRNIRRCGRKIRIWPDGSPLRERPSTILSCTPPKMRNTIFVEHLTEAVPSAGLPSWQRTVLWGVETILFMGIT